MEVYIELESLFYAFIRPLHSCCKVTAQFYLEAAALQVHVLRRWQVL